MKIGRMIRNETEEYGILHEGLWYPQTIQRNEDGLETFLFDMVDFNLENGIELANEEVEWLSPIANPGKILCIGRNYAEHSREQGKEPETTPLIFSKFRTSLTGHLSEVEYPSHTQNLDYEVELAIIIGKKASKLETREEAWDHIYGYTIANDLTARDVQKSEKQWTRGKGFDQSLPMGPFIVKSNSIEKPVQNEIWLTVNGEKRQLSTTANMIFSIPYLIHYISQTITLLPGDIILTGTPEGVGYYMEPKQVLNKGDFISCGITEIGELRFSIKNG